MFTILPSTRVNYISRSTFLTYLPWSHMAVGDGTVPASFPTGKALALGLCHWPWPWQCLALALALSVLALLTSLLLGLRQWRPQTITATRWSITATSTTVTKYNGILIRNWHHSLHPFHPCSRFFPVESWFFFSDSFQNICVWNFVFPTDFQHPPLTAMFKSTYFFH